MECKQGELEAAHFLSGWKEIANYLGKGVRPVQRYELELGLPIRRPAKSCRGSVLATKPEIDAWVAASPIRHEFRLSRVMVNPAGESWAALKDGMAKMAALRDQMDALRTEVKASVNALRNTVQNISADAFGKRFETVASPKTRPN